VEVRVVNQGLRVRRQVAPGAPYVDVYRCMTNLRVMLEPLFSSLTR